MTINNKSQMPGSGVFALIGVLMAAAGTVSAETSPKITIAIANEPPYTSLKEDGSLSGAGPDIDRAALKESGLDSFDGQTVPYGAMIPALQANRVGMVSSGALVIRPERCKAVIFSEPVICNSEAFLIHQEDAGRFSTYKQVAELGLKVAALAGSVQERSALAAGVLRSNITNFPDGTSAVKMLQDKRVDVVALNDAGTIELQKKSGDSTLQVVFPVSDAPIGCAAAAFRKNDTDLRDKYNAGLKKMVASGEYQKIMDNYNLQTNAKLLASAPSTETLCAQ
nr:ectoine/hydroxyectoine ABC transporter substrate-binding protein EhuB [uncultured Pseudomonas sp.]